MNDVSGGSGDDGLLRANESLAIDAREKQELRAALEAKEKELVSVKSRNYDLVKEKEALQQEVAGGGGSGPQDACFPLSKTSCSGFRSPGCKRSVRYSERGTGLRG